jgi:hypothetical protein
MTDHEFDQALIAGAFALAATGGWPSVSPAAAAREAGLSLDRARSRFADRAAILHRFGTQADGLALAGSLGSGPVRERLFDVMMRRFDALQSHRAGVLALLRHLPADPLLSVMLAADTARSMGWMLDACGVPAQGLRGMLATQGLTAVWLYTLNAWRSDESADLSGTMAALDRALSRAEQAAGWTMQPAPEPGPKPFPDPEAGIETLSGTLSGAAETPPPM